MLHNSQLGKTVHYKSTYDRSLLFALPRALKRAELDLNDHLPFHGVDIWNAYELSWLNDKGKPIVRLAKFTFPCDSTHIIESKSFKLYLNSFNQTRFSSAEIVKNIMQYDLSSAAGAKVRVDFSAVDKPLTIAHFPGICLDDLDIDIQDYQPNTHLLSTLDYTVTETVYSNLLKSNCPITHQPDWASVMIRYQGAQIDHKGLLQYIISFREHNDFHEHCVERMFSDILRVCQPEKLTVYARYTRRGGLDINPFRSNFESLGNNLRLSRQ